MTWLLWKEYRLNRLIVIVGAMLLVVPHLMSLILVWYDAGIPLKEGMSRLSQNLMYSAGYSLVLSQLTLALLGGNAIACERMDRSAEFLAYLPLSRRRILAGKIVLPLLAAALIWGLNLSILKLTFPAQWLSDAQVREGAAPVLGGLAVTGLVFFGAGWLLSSALESPTLAVSGGLITPIIVVTGVNTVHWLFKFPEAEFIGLWYRGICFGLAPACFVVGTWYYLHRVEP